MSVNKINKQMCVEKYARRCAICGSNINTVVRKLNKINASEHLSNLILLCEECNSGADSISDAEERNRVGVVLCGGKGTRLYPITINFNKHLLPLALSHMITYPVRTLRRLGIKRVLIVVDRESGSKIIEVLGSGSAYGMEFTYRIQDGANGIADALYLAKDFVKPDDKIFCILGDNIFDNNQLDPDFELAQDNLACVFVKEISNPKDYGVAVIKNNRIIKIIEKPNNFVSNLGVLGLYVYTNQVFEIIEKIKPSKRGELEISDINHFYANSGVLQHQVVKGYWADCGGSIQRYTEASMYGAKEAKVSAEEIDSFRAIVFDDK